MAASEETSSGSKARQGKAVARALLATRDLQGLRRWVRENRNPLRTLTALLYDDDRLICRRAVEALGIAAGLEAGRNLENARRLVHRARASCQAASRFQCPAGLQTRRESHCHAGRSEDHPATEYAGYFASYFWDDTLG